MRTIVFQQHLLKDPAAIENDVLNRAELMTWGGWCMYASATFERLAFSPSRRKRMRKPGESPLLLVLLEERERNAEIP